jgi:DNA processing protein
MPTELTERQALLVLSSLPGLGSITLTRLLQECGGDAREVFRMGRRRLESVQGVDPETGRAVAEWEKYFDLPREEERIHRSGADFLTASDTAYPRLLREIHDPPIGMYRKGSYQFELPCIAVVGTRRPTQYGLGVARSLGAELARLGFCVVSGLARGVDTAAHEGALEAKGRTAAVLGTGLDIVYPPENLDLYRRIAESGAVLSEFPLGRRPDRSSFARRNRLVSGMSEAVVVVESAVDGGAMITSRFAGEQGRLLFAVPGRIDQSTSAGCHQLIRDGATLLTSVEDILSELSYLGGLRPAPIPEKHQAAAPTVPAVLNADEQAVLAQLSDGAILASDALSAATGIGAAQVAAATMSLELKKLIVKRVDGAFEAAPDG